ncbi:hypothetical protein [Lutibacter flavus]|uniref:Uncharacterized protein n=1 Tax=Lutibacter flavus TaxID=691689 RepID=A0A238VLU7_9FLAO|nr:hypothetical protein [Lutibacter flavus]SNR34713.1 hypothetical protein SAMN04488111_0627 [Lutibacter flavus]
MKKILVILLLISPIISISQRGPLTKRIEQLENDIKKTNKTQDSILIELNKKSSELTRTTNTKETLEKELLFYRAKEDYFISALNRQESRFAVILTSILAILALLSFGVLRYELAKIKGFTKKKISEQTLKIIEHKDKLKGIDTNLNLALGNINMSIGAHFKQNNDLINSLKYYLIGAKHLGEWKLSKNLIEKKKDPLRLTINNLIAAKQLLDNIIIDNSLTEDVNKQIKKLNKLLDNYSIFENQEIIHLIAQIRVDLNNYIK